MSSSRNTLSARYLRNKAEQHENSENSENAPAGARTSRLRAPTAVASSAAAASKKRTAGSASVSATTAGAAAAKRRRTAGATGATPKVSGGFSVGKAPSASANVQRRGTVHRTAARRPSASSSSGLVNRARAGAAASSAVGKPSATGATSSGKTGAKKDLKYDPETFDLADIDNILKKRQKWDLRGKLNDLEDITAVLRAKIQRATSGHAEEIAALAEERSAAESERASLESKLSEIEASNAELSALAAKQRDEVSGLEGELAALEAERDSIRSTTASQLERMSELESAIAVKDKELEELDTQAREDELLRKKLHNTIQELKGNIRVYARIRPFVGKERSQLAEEDVPFDFCDPENHSEVTLTAPIVENKNGTKEGGRTWDFSFDRVFRPNDGQAEVFEEIAQLVQSALDGYRVSIFAYGQTGSGKTFTMEGPSGVDIACEESRGMIPRAVEQIFEAASTLERKGWKFELTASFLEIYNEGLRDLLVRPGAREKKLDIRQRQQTGEVYVDNLTVSKVSAPDQVYRLLETAAKNRATAATNCNERSSRSHSVFQLCIKGVHDESGQTNEGILNLIDLAGSERLAQSGATGERLKETQAINKSLSALGDVIASLANQSSHVPFRNSKLTYYLRSCLGGDSKTLMFVNVSSNPGHLNETLASLRFAAKVNSCDIGTARKNVKVDLKL